MEEQGERGGWIAMLVGGVVNLLFGLGYFVWSLVGLLWGGFAAIANIVDIAATDRPPVEMLVSVVLTLAPLISVVVFLFVPFLALITLFGAFRFKTYQSKGLVWLGVLCGLGAPLLALLSSVTSFCNCYAGCACCFGFLVGNLGTFIVGVIAVITMGYAAFCLTREDVAARFEANAQA